MYASIAHLFLLMVLSGALDPAHRFGSQVSITDMLTRLRPVVGVVYLSADHFGQLGCNPLTPA